MVARQGGSLDDARTHPLGRPGLVSRQPFFACLETSPGNHRAWALTSPRVGCRSSSMLHRRHSGRDCWYHWRRSVVPWVVLAGSGGVMPPLSILRDGLRPKRRWTGFSWEDWLAWDRAAATTQADRRIYRLEPRRARVQTQTHDTWARTISGRRLGRKQDCVLPDVASARFSVFAARPVSIIRRSLLPAVCTLSNGLVVAVYLPISSGRRLSAARNCYIEVGGLQVSG